MRSQINKQRQYAKINNCRQENLTSHNKYDRLNDADEQKLNSLSVSQRSKKNSKSAIKMSKETQPLPHDNLHEFNVTE